VLALPCCLKFILVSVILTPRLVLCGFLWWLGARWLTATVGFGNLLLNALALGFVLDLSELLYMTMVPLRGKLLVQRTFIPHVLQQETETCRHMFGMYATGVIASLLSVMYIALFQQVLPDYNWDIHTLCQQFLTKELSGHA